MNILTVPTEISVSSSSDKCTYCMSHWLEVSAKCLKCKVNELGVQGISTDEVVLQIFVGLPSMFAPYMVNKCRTKNTKTK